VGRLVIQSAIDGNGAWPTDASFMYGKSIDLCHTVQTTNALSLSNKSLIHVTLNPNTTLERSVLR